MDPFFYDKLSRSNAGMNSRKSNFDYVLAHPSEVPELVKMATTLSDKNHHKAVWMLEMLAERDAAMLSPYINILCKALPHYRHESSIRGMSRTVRFLSIHPQVKLTAAQEKAIIEACLDWLIGDTKVAPKAYAMYTLCHFSSRYPGLKDDLSDIIHKDFAQQSAAYKAAAREVLRKISA